MKAFAGKRGRGGAAASLGIVSLVGLLAACSGGGNAADPPNNAAAGSATEEPVPTLKLVLNLNPEINLKNNPVIQQAEKLAHVKLDIEAPPQNSYFDRLRVIMASGDLPDIFWGGTDVDFEKWSQQGLLATLDDKIASYPNLTANISKAQWGDSTALTDGKIHGVPRPNSYDRWGYLINQKWLDKLHLQAPATVDDFMNVARAFTNDDPDGNGQKDTVGFTTGGNADESNIFTLTSDFFSTAYNFSLNPGLPASDSKFHTNATSPDFLPYLTKLRDMYKEGIIDRDFITYKGTEYEERFASGKAGIIGISDRNVGVFLKKYNLNPADYTYHIPLKNLASGEAIYNMPPSNWGAFQIPASSKNIDAALKFLDWANSQEGFELFQLGLQDTNYNSYDAENGTVDRTPEQIQQLTTITSSSLAFAEAYRGREAIVGGDTQEERDKFNKEALEARKDVTEYYVPFIKQLSTFKASIPDQTATLTTLETRYVNGDISEDELKKFIDGTYKPLAAQTEQDINAYMAQNPIVKKKGGE
ncbi:extracellular solute-binding protein [Paenibacillus sp. MWE-103]|uniref:Extracellular solute-binding protein n=1 Tax=Paenibacillus artemisiicola TaxID=1172618 RepID=A0ABS3W803_9BACL|nr:extracellular solute-binding protein [Paenibacillus artemisiicola]MBO7744437.1 extracellular solute-binding protein [Paenibacillus artemisiicola]